MKTKKLKLVVISVVLVIVSGITYCLPSFLNAKQISNTQSVTRTIEVQQAGIDFQSLFDGYEDISINTVGSITSFEGTKTFDLADYYDFDLVADKDTGETAKVQVKYNYSYDEEANIVILTAILIDGDGNPETDTMIGAPFIDENGNFDAVFDCDDGEYILLSEIQDAGMIANCKWLKKICKKVKTAVNKTAKAVGEFVHDNASALVPLAIGIVGGLTGGAMIPVLIAGTVAGAAISGGQTAYASYKATGKVDWTATAISTGMGAAVGLISSYIGYGIGMSLNPYQDGYDNSNTNNDKQYNSYTEFKSENGTANNSSIKYGSAGTSGNYEWHHIVEQNQIGNTNVTAQNVYSTHNTISLGYDTHRYITRIYSTNISNLNTYEIGGLRELFTNAQETQTVRSYMSALPYETQYDIGIKILRLLGVNI